MLIEIPGKPIALQRHRHHAGGTFDPQKREKEFYAVYVQSTFREPPLEEALAVQIDYIYVPPKSWSKKKKEAAMGAMKISTPDLSNLVKFTEDALNGVLWEDDKQIVALKASKCYGECEKTILKVEKVDENYI